MFVQGESRLLGDLMVLLKAAGACEYVGLSQAFCDKHRLRYKAMVEMRKLRKQLTDTGNGDSKESKLVHPVHIVNSVVPDAQLVIDPKMAPPSEEQTKLLRQVVLAGLGDHVARRRRSPPAEGEDATKWKGAYEVFWIIVLPIVKCCGSVQC